MHGVFVVWSTYKADGQIHGRYSELRLVCVPFDYTISDAITSGEVFIHKWAHGCLQGVIVNN